MVSDGCGDCARRLPQKIKTQTNMQTKRAIMTSNLRGSSEHLLSPGDLRRWLGGAQPQATLGGTPGEVILAGPALACVVTGLRPVKAGRSPASTKPQFVPVTPPYFFSHFNSSRTLIFPCQGFFASSCPSPGKISKSLGTFSSCRARSSK